MGNDFLDCPYFLYLFLFFLLSMNWKGLGSTGQASSGAVVMTIGTDRSRMRQGKHGFRREPVGI